MARLTPAQVNLLKDIEQEVADDPDHWDDWFEISPDEIRTAQALARKGKLKVKPDKGKPREVRLVADPRNRNA